MVPVCSVHWLPGSCIALSRCLRCLFWMRRRRLSSPVTSLPESPSRGGPRPSCSTCKASVLVGISPRSFPDITLNSPKLTLHFILPCPPYNNSGPGLNVSGFCSPRPVVCWLGVTLIPGVSPFIASARTILFATTVSIGPSTVSNRWSPAHEFLPPPVMPPPHKVFLVTFP